MIEPYNYSEPREIPCRLRLVSARSPGRRELRERRPRDIPEIGPPVEPFVVLRRLPAPGRWLEQVYTLCAEGKFNPALYLVLNELDELLHERDVARCDAILAAADVGQMPVEVRMAFLMGTFRARTALRARKGFLDRVETRLRLETPDRVEALLATLR